MYYTPNEPKQVVGMAYVPIQPFMNIYPLDKGFMRGTVFQHLDKPFMGGKSK